MKKLLFLFGLLVCPLFGRAQVPAFQNVIFVSSAPSGACTNGSPAQIVISTGVLYTCQASTWAIVGGGGGGGPYLPLAGGVVTGALGTNAEFSNGTCTTAVTINPANGNRQKVTLTNADACALTFTQPSSGTISITLKIIQSSAGSFNGTISGGKWPGGVVPTITATSAAVDFISCYLDGTNAYCVASQNFQ